MVFGEDLTESKPDRVWHRLEAGWGVSLWFESSALRHKAKMDQGI